MSKGVFDRFFALLAQMPGADKEELVWRFSNMLTTSLREFYEKNPDGFRVMLAAMQAEVDKNIVNRDNEQEVKRLRSAILHRLQKNGIDTTSWARVNQFLEQKRIAGKRLYEMSVQEMSELIPKLENILSKHRAKIEFEKNSAKNN